MSSLLLLSVSEEIKGRLDQIIAFAARSAMLISPFSIETFHLPTATATSQMSEDLIKHRYILDGT